MATKKQMAKKNKKILKLERQIAKVNGHKDFAFDADKIDHSGFDSYIIIQGLRKNRQILTIFDFPIRRFFDFVLLVRTDRGVFWFNKHVVTVSYEPEKIVIVFETSSALQKVTVLGFKILSPSGFCMVTKDTQSAMRPGDVFKPDYTIKVD